MAGFNALFKAWRSWFSGALLTGHGCFQWSSSVFFAQGAIVVAILDHEGEEEEAVLVEVEGEGGHLESEEDRDTLRGRKAKASNLF